MAYTLPLVGTNSSLYMGPQILALKIAQSCAHSWSFMRHICIELASIYGDLTSPIDNMVGSDRLKHSSFYVSMAAKLSTQLAFVMESTALIEKGGEKSPVLQSLIGKDELTSRDLQFFLRDLLGRKTDIHRGSFEWELTQDIHALLAKNYSAYAAACCFKASDPAQYSIMNDCIFTVWQPEPDRGGYMVYFVLGSVAIGAPQLPLKDKKKSAQTLTAMQTSTRPKEKLCKRCYVDVESFKSISSKALKLVRSFEDASALELVSSGMKDLLLTIALWANRTVESAEAVDIAGVATIKVKFELEPEAISVSVSKAVAIIFVRCFDFSRDGDSIVDQAVCLFFHASLGVENDKSI